jgi:hypothetical protein
MEAHVTNELWKCSLYSDDSIAQTMMTTSELSGRRVCIIGGGVTGLGIAGILALKGISSVIVDRRSQLGGVWTDEACCYAGLRIHTPSYYFQYLDDDATCEGRLPELLKSRRTDAEQRAYLENYARRHRVLFLGECEVRHQYTNRVEIASLDHRQRASLQFDWVIDCTASRPNAGTIRVLPNAEVLKDEILARPRTDHIVVVGAGKSGADAVVYCAQNQFKNVTWICSRKIGFCQREPMEARDEYLASMEAVLRQWRERRQSNLKQFELVTPHDGIDCCKFGIIDREELAILRAASKLYGRVASVAHTSATKRIMLTDGRQVDADCMISAIGPDGAGWLRNEVTRGTQLAGRALLLDSIDPLRRFIVIRNRHLETATGASLEGLLTAGFINGEITARAISAISRVRLVLPPIFGGCMTSGLGVGPSGSLPPDDAMIRESYVTQLLGFPTQPLFRLIDREKRKTLLSLSG